MSRILKITETVDHETGELLTTSNEYTVQTKIPKFFMIISGNLPDLLKMLTGGELKALLILESEAEYNENKVNLTTALRLEVAKKSGIPLGSFNNVLSSLKKKGIITINNGEIKIKPKYLWKGETKHLKKKIIF